MVKNKKVDISITEQILIMLHEYDTLRTEVIEYVKFSSNIFTIFFSVILAIFGISIEIENSNLIFMVPLILLMLFAFDTHRNFNVSYLGMNISCIEKQVNEMAGRKLLYWESNLTITHIHKFIFRIGGKKKPILNFSYILGIQPLFLILSTILFIWGTYIGWMKIVDFLLKYHFDDRLSYFYPVFIGLNFFLILYSRFKQQPVVLSEYNKRIDEIRINSDNI